MALSTGSLRSLRSNQLRWHHKAPSRAAGPMTEGQHASPRWPRCAAASNKPAIGTVNGHSEVPVGGQHNCPLVAMETAWIPVAAYGQGGF